MNPIEEVFKNLDQMSLDDICRGFKKYKNFTNSTDSDGNTILHQCIMHKKSRIIIEILICYGADIHKKNKYNITPIQLGRMSEDDGVKKLFDSMRFLTAVNCNTNRVIDKKSILLK